MNLRNHFNLPLAACVTAFLALLLVSPASAQTWTGEELLTSGDWVETSFAADPTGSRTYEVVGTSLRWVSGNGTECSAAGSPFGGRCIAERTFRLPLPSTCTETVRLSYSYTNEGSPTVPGSFGDNDFWAGIGSATTDIFAATGDTGLGSLAISSANYSDLNAFFPPPAAS